MDRLTTQDFSYLLSIRNNPCISIYLPVDKVGQDTRQGAIRLRKLVKATAESLHERGLRTPQIEQLLQPAEALYDHALFWEHQNNGLALFLSQDGMLLHQLTDRCAESVTIADRFMVVPILAEAAQDSAFFLLALSLEDTQLYLGTRHSLTDCVLPDPRSIKTVIDAYTLERQLQHHSNSVSTGGTVGTGGTVFHGSESARDNEKQRIEEFFRQIDGNLVKILAETDAPLVVACVDYLFPIFRAVCKYNRLMDEHISGSPENMKKDNLQEKAFDIARAVFERDRSTALNHYAKLAGTNRVRQDVAELLPMAFQGRVDSVFIRRNSEIWGRWNPETGQVLELLEEQDRFGDPDLLDEVAVLTLDHGGRVFVLDEDMPVQNDCAGLLRF